jgi:hypothetical protein
VDRPTNQPTTNNQRLLAEELNYSGNGARRHQCPTNNLLEVWQNLAPFGGGPIGGAVEVLSTNVINCQSSVLLIFVFFVAPCHAAGSVLWWLNKIIKRR